MMHTKQSTYAPYGVEQAHRAQFNLERRESGGARNKPLPSAYCGRELCYTFTMLLTTTAQKDYELLDSGEGQKLERFGNFVVSRPDPQALWMKRLPQSEWDKAGARYETVEKEGKWVIEKNIPASWPISLGNLSFMIKPASFKHVGVFPEQFLNWQWIEKACATQEKPKVLNLFGYTGGASLAALKGGAEVVHVDGSKTAVSGASENANLSGVGDKPVRWIVDDARVFVKREIKRGHKYDGIILDPPAFGRGPKGEVWKIEDDLLPLLKLCGELLSDHPLFFLLNGYASGYSSIAYEANLKALMEGKKGTLEHGELTIEESGSGRLLPAGIFARWQGREVR